jgi:hypothetical protein
LIVIVGYVLYKNAIKAEKFVIILIVIGVVFNQISSNFFCGTDNISRTYYIPFDQCAPFLFLIEMIIPCLFFAYYFLFFSYHFSTF